MVSRMKCVIYLIVVFVCVVNSKKAPDKRDLPSWRVECELGVISDSECPVSGGWSAWSAWSECHGACDAAGSRRRARECSNPPPARGGSACVGASEDAQPCRLADCTLDHFRRLVRGDAARAAALHQLDAAPAIQERCLELECSYEAIEAALLVDNTWKLDAETVWNALLCVKRNVGCAAEGGWGAWSDWSGCGARCGRGVRWRLRCCDAPLPSAAHLGCEGEPLEAAACDGDQCAIDEATGEEVGGEWAPWGAWTACSESCGAGVRRRRRGCRELRASPPGAARGTHCRGQHDQLQICEHRSCELPGGWSGWSAWSACSRSCGAGVRERGRSCTRPAPAGGGARCAGARTERAACNVKPCAVYAQQVAHLHGDGYLQYKFDRKRSTLFHLYVRLRPRAPSCSLVRRAVGRGGGEPLVSVTLRNWHVCLEAGGGAAPCRLPRACSPAPLEPHAWHTLLVAVTTESATLRIDDAPVPVRASFPCDPQLPDDKMNIWIGEKLQGEIQEAILNFIPLQLRISYDRRDAHDFSPHYVSNVIYDEPSIEEAFLHLENDYYVRFPCFNEQDEWKIETTIKSKRESGTVLCLLHENQDTWLLLSLQYKQLKLKLQQRNLKSESSSSTEHLLDEWLDISLSKRRGSDTIEAVVNGFEKLHVAIDKGVNKRRSLLEKLYRRQNYALPPNTSGIWNALPLVTVRSPDPPLAVCPHEFFLGGVPEDIKTLIPEDLTPFHGIVASLSINSVLQDLHEFSVERTKDGKVYVSSRTASISGSYHETAWGRSNRLNLTCLYARTLRSPRPAHWLYLDVVITNAIRNKAVRSVDDGRVLRLVASADNDLRGFYTCRALAKRRIRNVVTYGVLGKVQYKLSTPDTTTAVAVVTTVTLVMATIAWLVIEGIYDLRNGYGFFRDRHLSPEEEMKVVCDYIDDNMDLVGSENTARVAKARARRKATRLASGQNYGAQEPEGLNQVRARLGKSSESSSDPELPVLPAIAEPEQQTYWCEPSYASSPRHGSALSAGDRITSTSHDLSSPRYLCTRLLMSKRVYSSGDRSVSRRTGRHRTTLKRPCLMTIKSSTFVEPRQSPAQKVLRKFQLLNQCDTTTISD